MAEKLESSLVVRMSPELNASLMVRAEQAGLSRSEFARLILSLPIIVDPCGPKAVRRAEKYRREQDFLSDVDEAFGSDLDSDSDGIEISKALSPSDFKGEAVLDSPQNQPRSGSVIARYTPSEGVAEALAKLDYCVHSDVVPQFHPRKSGRPRAEERPDRYAIEPIKIIYITDDEARALTIAIDRWGTNLNQSTRALNTIAKYIREQNIDDELHQYILAGINNVDELLNVTIEGLSELIQMVTELLSSRSVTDSITMQNSSG